jgi:hypothetical protein
MPLRLLRLGSPETRPATTRAASVSVSFVERDSTAANNRRPASGSTASAAPIAVASRVETFPAVNATNVSGAASTVSAACNRRTVSPTPIPVT